MQTYYFSGSQFPVPVSYSGGLLGSTDGSIWQFDTYPSAIFQVGGGRALYFYPGPSGITWAPHGSGVVGVSGGGVYEYYPDAGGPFVATFATTGDVYGLTSSGSTFSLGSGVYLSGAVGSPYWGALSTSGTAYGVMGPSGFGSITFGSGLTTGVTGAPSGWLEVSCLAPISGTLNVGGWGAAVFASGAMGFGINPSGTVGIAASNVSGGSFSAWGAPTGTSGLWSFVSSISGTGTNLGRHQIAFYSPTSAVCMGANFRALSYVGGTLTQTQSAVLTGTVGYIAVIDNMALVPQPATSRLILLGLSGNTWVTSGYALSGLGGVGPVVTTGVSGAVGKSSGIVLFDWDGSAWNTLSSAALAFTPQDISLDVSGNYFVAGRGRVALVSNNGTVLASGQFDSTLPNVSGTASYHSQYYVVTTGYVGVLQYQPWSSGFSLISSGAFPSQQMYWNGSVWSQQSGSPIGSDCVWDGTSLLIPSTLGIMEYEMSAPYALSGRRAGTLATYSGGYANLSGVGLGNVPCGVAPDASGNARFITILGNMITLSGGAVSAQTQVYSGGLCGWYSGASGMQGAAAMAPLIIQEIP